MPADAFFESVMSTALAPDELIVAIRFPDATRHEGTAFRLFNRRHGDFAIVAVAACIALDGRRVAHLRLGIGGVEAVPVSLTALAAAQTARLADPAWVAEMAAAARDAVDAQDDGRITAGYRRELTEVLVGRALGAAIDRACA